MTLEEKLNFFKEKGFTYDPTTGIIKSHKGKIMMTKDGNGYIRIGLFVGDKKIHIRGHQYAWYIYYNEVYTKDIDHINNDHSDNRIENLRHITHQQNAFNIPSVKGCYFNKRLKRWQSYIHINAKAIYLGLYLTEEEAHQVYLDAKKKYHII